MAMQNMASNQTPKNLSYQDQTFLSYRDIKDNDLRSKHDHQQANLDDDDDDGDNEKMKRDAQRTPKMVSYLLQRSLDDGDDEDNEDEERIDYPSIVSLEILESEMRVSDKDAIHRVNQMKHILNSASEYLLHDKCNNQRLNTDADEEIDGKQVLEHHDNQDNELQSTTTIKSASVLASNDFHGINHHHHHDHHLDDEDNQRKEQINGNYIHFISLQR